MRLYRNLCILSKQNRYQIRFDKQNRTSTSCNAGGSVAVTVRGGVGCAGPTAGYIVNGNSDINSKYLYSPFKWKSMCTIRSGEPPLTKYQALEMVHKLTENERNSLRDALYEYESQEIKSKLVGELAATRWRTKFSRTLPGLGNVDPTGSYCAMPDDWLQKKLANKSLTNNSQQSFKFGAFKKSAATAVPPSRQDLFKIMLVNAVPFIGFGFLDNFLMIIAGDLIEYKIGLYISISTMAAAALGNTISDICGLGLAHYVELFCEFLGLKTPQLTPEQMEMKSSRNSASMGRVVGITIGCLLGMCPLWFMNIQKSKSDPEQQEIVDNKVTTIATNTT